MNKAQDKLKRIFAETLCLPSDGIEDSLSMSDVESWDSLRHMQLIATIETEYGLLLDFDEIVQMRSVEAIRQTLSRRGVEC